MEWITTESVIKCSHRGKINNVASQDWVRVETDDGMAPVLVDNDPAGRDIDGCPNSGPQIKKCGKTENVRTGYSTWIRIGGNAVVLSNLDGLTNGTPPRSVPYRVTDPKQLFVRGDA